MTIEVGNGMAAGSAAASAARDTRAGWTAAAGYLGLSLLLVLPLLVGVSTLSGDAPVHIRWQAGFAPMVWDGTLYPRWLAVMNDGFGSPAFFFYPPMLQWLGALFRPIAADPVARLCLAVWLASALGAIGCRAWLRALRLPPAAATVGGAVFLLMPYRAFVDVYQRGALPELVGISVMPWLLCFAVRLRGEGRNNARASYLTGWSGYAVSVAAILYSHLPAALMGLLLSSACIAVLSLPRDWRLLLRGVSATIVGIALAAPCIIPALGLLDHLTDTTAMFGARNQPVNWLLFAPAPWIDPAMQLMTLVLTAAAVFGGAGAAVVAWRSGDRSLRPTVAFLFGAVLVVALLNTEPSRAFWALQTPLSRIQFPFRLLGVQAVALSGLVALALAAARQRPPLRHTRIAVLLLLAAPGLLAFDAALIGVQAWRDRDTPAPGTAEILATSPDSSEYVLGDPAAARRFGQGRQWIVAGEGRVTRAAVTDRRVDISVAAATAVTVALHQFAFTGWQCRIDGGAWQSASRLPAPLRLATCRVPAGTRRVEARLPATPFESWSWYVAALGLLLVVVDLIRAIHRKPPATPR